MSWNARRFDPTAKNLCRHLRHKSKIVNRVSDAEEPITFAEIQAIAVMAVENGLFRILMCARVAERAVELERKLAKADIHFRELETELTLQQPTIYKLQQRVAYLENQLARLRNR